MRNIFILYMPPGNPEAMVHYEDTIKNRVAQGKIFQHIDKSLQSKLREIFGDKSITVWGSQDGPQNRSRFTKMKPGDDVLIVEGDTIRLLGKIAATTINEDLSRDLWKTLDGSKEDNPWKLIYFIANPVEIELPFTRFKKLFNYSDEWSLRGFTNVADDKLETFYGEFDDLYSILMRLKSGEKIEKKEEPTREVEKEVAEEREGEQEKLNQDEISDHIRMQWMLLQLGLKSGSKVWIPKNDQKNINEIYDYEEFEPEFTSGIDTPAKYVEQIDVIWKEEFRIDAAFEVENSTAIYSGLLRFSDLKLIAPNSNYPLFIVAPLKKKNRVFSQVNRPTFKRMEFEKKVRYLSYERVEEINTFFNNSPGGLNTETLIAKSERIS